MRAEDGAVCLLQRKLTPWPVVVVGILFKAYMMDFFLSGVKNMCGLMKDNKEENPDQHKVGESEDREETKKSKGRDKYYEPDIPKKLWLARLYVCYRITMFIVVFFIDYLTLQRYLKNNRLYKEEWDIYQCWAEIMANSSNFTNIILIAIMLRDGKFAHRLRGLKGGFLIGCLGILMAGIIAPFLTHTVPGSVLYCWISMAIQITVKNLQWPMKSPTDDDTTPWFKTKSVFGGLVYTLAYTLSLLIPTSCMIGWFAGGYGYFNEFKRVIINRNLSVYLKRAKHSTGGGLELLAWLT